MAQRIIVCDEEPHIVRAISLKFTRAGFDVQGVANGESCWRLLQRKDAPAMLIIDQMILLKSTGADVIQHLQGHSHLAKLPLFVLTNSLLVAEQGTWRSQLNLVGVASKPFSPRELLADVTRILNPQSAVPPGMHLKLAGNRSFTNN